MNILEIDNSWCLYVSLIDFDNGYQIHINESNPITPPRMPTNVQTQQTNE